MDVEKQRKSEDKTRDINDQSLERLHRDLFDHPNEKEWKATRSLAQPSFLKQIDSHGGGHSKLEKVSAVISEK